MSDTLKPANSIANQEKPISKKDIQKSLLVECAWEAVNQVGGIYTVIRSKAPSMINTWGSHYCLLGPYFADQATPVFEPFAQEDDYFGRAVQRMREQGFEVHYGQWLVTGRPKAVLVNPYNVFHRLDEIKYMLWENHGISFTAQEDLVDQVVAFGLLCKIFLKELCQQEGMDKNVIAHFHEWMAGSAIPQMRREDLPVTSVFTTHATILGRYLAMNDEYFYDHLPFFDWLKEASHFNIEAQARIERAAAHGSQVFSTVSEVTARECVHLIGREPDVVLPNGINIERFANLHEFQNLHQEHKREIHQFVMAHFFPSYTFDLDKTLYFFTSGRFEYRNKGFDITLEALARLNYRLKMEKSDLTIVMFFVTKQPYHSINPNVLQSRAVLEELRHTVHSIQSQAGERLFYAAAWSSDHKLPPLNDFVDDYWKLRYRRILQSWKSHSLPPIVTHNLHDDGGDPILNYLRTSNLVNHSYDRVKVVYHPDFISYTNPLFGIDYRQFVRGCHLGIFPSYYEPWGYTPLECTASGVPAVTSDLSGFGDYVMKEFEKPEEEGMYVVNRKNADFNKAANQLADQLYAYSQQTRRDRINQRNATEAGSVNFDWNILVSKYEMAYDLALKRMGQ